VLQRRNLSDGFKEPIDAIQGTNRPDSRDQSHPLVPPMYRLGTLETALRHPRSGTSAPLKRHFSTLEAALQHPQSGTSAPPKRQSPPLKRLLSEQRKSTKKLLPARKMAQKPPLVQEKSRQDSPTDGISAPKNRHFQFFSPPFHPPIFSTKSLQNSKSRQRLTTKETARLPPTQTARAISRNSKPVGSACSQRASGLQSNVKMGE